MTSYRAMVLAAEGSVLLGGVKVYVSSRFERREHAKALAKTIIETNEAAGRRVANYRVIKSRFAPEITAKEIEGESQG